jgi:chorismate mutase
MATAQPLQQLELEQDPVVRELRNQISDNDLALVEAINKRLRLVTRLRDYKAARSYPFLDHAREEWMLTFLSRANRGPLSADGLEEIYAALLHLTKRELSLEEPLADRIADATVPG